eukprot:Hpha_TRINITY_DN15609_c3_g2::TRINITY_DN15609_c3_g2_i2::g.98742::m.98742
MQGRGGGGMPQSQPHMAGYAPPQHQGGPPQGPGGYAPPAPHHHVHHQHAHQHQHQHQHQQRFVYVGQQPGPQGPGQPGQPGQPYAVPGGYPPGVPPSQPPPGGWEPGQPPPGQHAPPQTQHMSYPGATGPQGAPGYGPPPGGVPPQQPPSSGEGGYYPPQQQWAQAPPGGQPPVQQPYGGGYGGPPHQGPPGGAGGAGGGPHQHQQLHQHHHHHPPPPHHHQQHGHHHHPGHMHGGPPPHQHHPHGGAPHHHQGMHPQRQMFRPQQHQQGGGQNRFGAKAQYTQGQHLDVLRSSGKWDPGVVTEVQRTSDGQIIYRVDVLNEYGYPTGIWKELNAYEAERMLRPVVPRSSKTQAAPSSGDPDLDARVERTLRRLEQEKAGLPQQAQGGAAAPAPAGDDDTADDRIDRRLREIEAKTGKVSDIPPQQKRPGAPASAGPAASQGGPRMVQAPDGSMMDADLEERLQARLRKTEAMAKQKREEADGGKVIHTEEEQREIGGEDELPEEHEDGSQPDSEQEKWLAEQLGEDIAHEADLDDEFEMDAEASLEAHAQWLEEKRAAGQEVRGVCPICCFEVLSDMPRFKIDENYFHEECRAAASERGYQCAAPGMPTSGGKGKGKGKGAPPASPPSKQAAAPAAQDEEARLREQVARMEKEVAETKPPAAGSEHPAPTTPVPGDASPRQGVTSPVVAEAGDSPAAVSSELAATPQPAAESPDQPTGSS